MEVNMVLLNHGGIFLLIQIRMDIQMLLKKIIQMPII